MFTGPQFDAYVYDGDFVLLASRENADSDCEPTRN